MDTRIHLHVTHSFDPQQLELIMSALTDALTAAVTAAQTSLTALGSQVADAIAEISTLQAGPDETAVAAATTALGAFKTGLDSLSAQIATAIEPTAAPAALTASPASLPQPVDGTAYSEAVSLSGGSGMYTAATITGAAPEGMTASIDGSVLTVSGFTPAANSPPVSYTGSVTFEDVPTPTDPTPTLTGSVAFSFEF